MGMPGLDAEDPEFPYLIPGPRGATGAAGGASSWNAFTQDLGVATRDGSFTYSSASGLTTDQVVEVIQTAAQISSKGNAQDELEFDAITLTAIALSATSFKAYWQAPSTVVGTYAFAWR